MTSVLRYGIWMQPSSCKIYHGCLSLLQLKPARLACRSISSRAKLKPCLHFEAQDPKHCFKTWPKPKPVKQWAAVHLPLPEGTLRIVPTYRHLGTQAIASASLVPEWAARAQLSLMTAGALRKVFRSGTYHLPPKLMLAKASCRSRLLSATGTWHRPTQGQLVRLAKASSKPHRHIAHPTWNPSVALPLTAGVLAAR